MSDDRWPEIKQLLDQVLELRPDDRSLFLDERCAGDELLRFELDAYLELEEKTENFIETPAIDLLAGRPAELRTGQQLGPYRLERLLARGGMGVIYLACRADGTYRQKVAVKVLKRGLDTGDLVRRFRRERQILAGFNHPLIARILDGGATDDGLPYFVMEHVAGTPIDVYCEDQGLTVADRLELFVRVCNAVHAAHQNLVVHCDLKPSNILVTSAGDPRLLDFGIAKLLRSGADNDYSRTLVTLRLGTPEYASPEQHRGEAITTASDVYSLGVLLYKLLVGRCPSREEGPILKPSVAVQSQNRSPDERIPTARRLQGDLDTIVLKAMHLEPDERYASAAELAEDLHRHLQHLPVRARPDTALYHVTRFLQRHPLKISAWIGFAVATMLFYVQFEHAKMQQHRALEIRGAYLELLEAIDPSSQESRSKAAHDALEHALHTEFVSKPEDRALLLDRIGRIYYRIGLLDDARRLLESSLEIRRQQANSDTSQLASSLNNLALVLIQLGETQRARNMLREALDIQEQDGASHASWLDEMSNLATALQNEGRYSEAEDIFRRVLEQKRVVHGGDSREFASGLNNLGQVLVRRNRLAAAEPLIREALERYRELLGSEHPRVATILMNLAALLDARGDGTEAIGLYRQALAIRRRHLDSEDPSPARTQAALAFALLGRSAANDLAEAEQLLRIALEIHLEHRGPDHPDTLVVQRNLAATLLAQGRPAEAEPLSRDVAGRAVATWPAGHWRIADASSVLGGCLVALGRYAEAEPLLVNSLQTIREIKGDTSRYARNARERILILYYAWGKAEEARRYAED